MKNLEERNRYLKKAEKEHRNILKEEYFCKNSKNSIFIFKRYIFKNPNSSIEKIEGAVFRLDYESKLRKK